MKPTISYLKRLAKNTIEAGWFAPDHSGRAVSGETMSGPTDGTGFHGCIYKVTNVSVPGCDVFHFLVHGRRPLASATGYARSEDDAWRVVQECIYIFTESEA